MHFQSVFRERNGPKQIFIIKFHLFWPVELVEFDGNGISCRNGCRTPRSRYHTFSILSLLFYFQVYFSSKIRFILIPLRPIIFKLHPDRPLLNSLLLARTGRTRRNDLDHFHTTFFTKIHIFGKITVFSRSKFQTKMSISIKSIFIFKSIIDFQFEMCIFEILPPRFTLNFTSAKFQSGFHSYVFKIHIHSYKIYPEIHLSKSKFTPRFTFRNQNLPRDSPFDIKIL